MNFSDPKKIPDGRYFVKVTSDTSSGRVLKQLNNVVLNTPFAEGETVTITLPSAAVDQIKGVDLEILKAAEENSTSWFQKELKSQTLDAAFTKSLSDTSMNLSKMKNQGSVTVPNIRFGSFSVTSSFQFIQWIMSWDCTILCLSSCRTPTTYFFLIFKTEIKNCSVHTCLPSRSKFHTRRLIDY